MAANLLSYQNVLDWLLTSIRINGGAGSSAYYQLLKGWSLPYPETTGYIIPTLLDYHDYLEERPLFEAAESCARWLVDIQREDGSFPAGLGGRGEPVVFDTAMILFGLTAIHQRTGETGYREAVQKAIGWLLRQLGPEHRWTAFAYVPGYEPAYYTMVVWAILQAGRIVEQHGLKEKIARIMDRYRQWINPDSSVANWGFHPDSPALTHTIGYTWQGFLESALILEDKKLIGGCLEAGMRMVEIHQKKGQLAGTYDQNWNGNYAFKCLTGQAQFALFLRRLAEISGEKVFKTVSMEWIEDLGRYPSKLPVPGAKGGMAGSSPVWGPYQRFKYLNWAAKFYLDAVLERPAVQQSSIM